MSSGFVVRHRKNLAVCLLVCVREVYVCHALLLAECHFSLHGTTFRGFKCRRPDTWCIPREHQCNGLVNCPDGSDEDPRLCDGEHSRGGAKFVTPVFLRKDPPDLSLSLGLAFGHPLWHDIARIRKFDPTVVKHAFHCEITHRK